MAFNNNLKSGESQQVAETTQEVSGEWTLASADIEDMMEITRRKTLFLGNLNKYSLNTAATEIGDLFSLMQAFIESHFKVEQIKAYAFVDDDGNKWTFYDYKEMADEEDNDIEDLRWIFERGWGLYSHFVKKLGGGIPTEVKNRKKRFLGDSSGSQI